MYSMNNIVDYYWRDIYNNHNRFIWISGFLLLFVGAIALWKMQQASHFERCLCVIGCLCSLWNPIFVAVPLYFCNVQYTTDI